LNRGAGTIRRSDKEKTKAKKALENKMTQQAVEALPPEDKGKPPTAGYLCEY
jgi:hypothetical protein